MDVAKIEERIDRTAAGGTLVSMDIGGVKFENMLEVMEFAKLMSISGLAVPQHLRGEPGACLAVTVQSLEWRFSPFAVANKSYSVNGRIAYESQLIHAVIEARAPLEHRLKCAYEGDGENRVCIVTGHLRNEVDPIVYRSPLFSKILPKNSPLWKTDPDQQLWYYASRAWARKFCPDVLLGVYSKDELQDSHIGADNARDVTPRPSVGDRLKNKGNRGFSSQHVHDETGGDKKVASHEKTDATTGEVTQDSTATGGANEVASTAQGQGHQADAAATDNRSAGAAQQDGKTDANSVTQSKTEAQRQTQISPTASASGEKSQASDQGSATADSGASQADTSRSPQPDLLSGTTTPAGSKGEPSPGQTDGADGSRGGTPSAPDRLRSYSKALFSVASGGAAKLGKQSSAWIEKFGAFTGPEETKRAEIYAVHSKRVLEGMAMEAVKAKVEEIIEK